MHIYIRICVYFGEYTAHISINLRAYTSCTYRYVFMQKYVHIHAYTYIRYPKQGVSNWTYSLEFRTNTAPVKPTYCSREVIYVHIRSYTCIYCIVRIHTARKHTVYAIIRAHIRAYTLCLVH